MVIFFDRGADVSLIKAHQTSRINRELVAPPVARIHDVFGKQLSLAESSLRVQGDKVNLYDVHFYIVTNDAFTRSDVPTMRGFILMRNRGRRQRPDS